MTEPRAAVQAAADELLRALDGLTGLSPVRVIGAAGGLACMIQVWDAARMMPTARGPKRDGIRRADILALVREAGRPLTRKQVVRGLKDAKKTHGVGTVAKALAELTRSRKLINPKDKQGYRLPDWPRLRKTPSLFD